MAVSMGSLWLGQGRTGALRTQGLIVLLPGGGKLLKTLVADLGLVKLFGVAGELMKNDVAIALLGNALPCLFQGLGHCEEYKCCAGKGAGLSMAMSMPNVLQYVGVESRISDGDVGHMLSVFFFFSCSAYRAGLSGLGRGHL